MYNVCLFVCACVSVCVCLCLYVHMSMYVCECVGKLRGKLRITQEVILSLALAKGQTSS